MDWKKKEYWLVLSLVAVTALYCYVIRYQRIEPLKTADLSQIPDSVGDWVGTDFSFDDNVLEVLKADKTLWRRYVNSSGQEIWLFIGYWRNQKYGAQPHSPLHCLPGSGWNIVSNELVALHSETNGSGLVQIDKANFAAISNGKQSESMLYWYQTRSGCLSKELSVKLDLVKNALLRKPTDAAFVRITSPMLQQDKEQALETLQDFWAGIEPQVEGAFLFE